MPHELPTGTVTFLFTDIEGSTRLLHELGAEAYAQALAEHRRLLREAFARRGGVEVDTQGDAFFYVFPTAPGALQAGADGQRALSSGPISVRMGLHTGTPHMTDEGYVGADVHRAARIAACAYGGQVLVSASTAALVGRDGLRDLGEHRLKDLSVPERIYQLGHGDFPPLRSLNQTNLPLPATPFLGRAEEVAEVVDLLRSQSVRLLTLTGVGGTGKTRLAIEAASELVPEYEHGVWWVPLSPLREPSLVLESAAQTLGASEELGEYVGDRQLLFLFDNFEHLLEAVPALGDLLARCANAKALVTSREPLHLAAEREYAVPTLAEAEATELFCARSLESGPEDVVAAICRRLDCLPLAVELAAARTKVLSPAAILERLKRSLPLLTGGPRDAPERQQTLQATIAWSHDLLSPNEQRLFAGLSFFAGGCTLEAAETVCSADLDVLESLVDKSLVRRSGERFWMLETIREFALERLGEREADGQMLHRYADYFLAGAEENYGAMFHDLTPGQLDWFGRERDNLRAALDRLQESGAASELELRLVAACVKFWIQGGYWTEALRRIEAALERACAAPASLRAHLLWNATDFAWSLGDYERGKELAEAAVALYDELGASGTEPLVACINLAKCEARLGDPERATETLESAARIARTIGDERSLALTMNFLGNLALEARDFARARPFFEESAAINRRLERQVFVANDLVDLGFLALSEGRPDEAATNLRESLAICRKARIAPTLVWAVEGIAALALARDAAVATRLFAATDLARAEMAFGEGYYPIADEIREPALESARKNLGETAFAAAWAEGRRLSIEEAAEAGTALLD